MTDQRKAIVLIVDDEAHIRLVVGDKLRSLDYTVIEAADGEEAFELARANVPDAIITDLQMPHMSGLDLTCALAGDPETAHIPSILLTARGFLLTKEQIESTNIQHVMSKPFAVRELVEHLRAIVDADSPQRTPPEPVKQ